MLDTGCFPLIIMCIYSHNYLDRNWHLPGNHDFKITGEETTYRFVLNNILNVNNNFFQFQKT